jgi:hypothetical protein
MMAADTMLGPRMDRIQRLALGVGIIGLALCVVGVFVDRAQFLRSYLWAYLFWNGMTIGSLGILIMQHVVGGRWGIVIRRMLEAGARTLPLMLILIIPILFGMGTLYMWTWPEVRSHDSIIQLKASYLNVPSFIIRILIYFVLWGLWAWMLIRRSIEQDRTGNPMLMLRMRQIAAPGLVVFTLASTFAFFDLIMSLEPHWFSTIYGAMFLIGQMLETFAFMIAVLVLLRTQPPFSEILTTQHFHDLGNMMFAFTILWAYCSFSQFIIIWAGNLPEEIPWYIRRFSGGWGVIAVIIVLFHFCVPFILMLYRFIKRSPELLSKVAILMICIRILDVFWVVEPAFYQDGMPLHKQVFGASWLDVVAPIGIGGIWVAFFIWHLKRHPLVPINDPRLMQMPRKMVEGIH